MKPARFAFMSHLDLNLWRFRLPIMKALVARGHEVHAVCPRGDYSARFAAEGVSHTPYGLERGSLNPLKEAFALADVARVLRRLRPDLLHTFTIKPNIYGSLAGRAVGVKRRVASVTGLGSFYENGRPSLGRRGLDALYKTALKGVNRVIFYNVEDRDELVRLGVCAPDQAVLIAGSGVDPVKFAPAPRTESGPVVVTMVSRVIKEKGVGEFLAAAEALKPRWGDKVLFQLAGEEDPGNPVAADADALARAVESGAVRRLGFVDDVAGLLRRSDVYALPSYYREGIPISVLEAMSTGLAVVTTDSVGCRETVVPEESGLRVPARDAAALAAALDRLIGDAALRRRLGAAARRRVEEVFSVEKIVAAHFDVYRPLLPEAGL